LLYAPANCGSPAVFWFFVISGYLVGGSVIAEIAQTSSFDFRRYLINRMTRLYVVLLPALALGALLDSVRIATWGANAHAGFENAASLSGVTLIGNIFYLQTIVVSTFGSNYPLWSLANEFWYYVTFPLLLAPLMVN
jgi:peptidoglycan/LPS O-acetylase OafA/YrhL